VHTLTRTTRITDVARETNNLPFQQVSGCITPGRGVGVIVIVLDLICILLYFVLVKYSIHGLEIFIATPIYLCRSNFNFHYSSPSSHFSFLAPTYLGGSFLPTVYFFLSLGNLCYLAGLRGVFDGTLA
jgi:hypothetical protein